MAPAPKKTGASGNHDSALLEFGKVLGTVATRVEAIYKAVQSTHDRVNLIDTRLIAVERSVGKLTAKVEDIQDDLTSALAAFDTDSVRVLDHEKRIVRLEKRALRV